MYVLGMSVLLKAPWFMRFVQCISAYFLRYSLGSVWVNEGRGRCVALGLMLGYLWRIMGWYGWARGIWDVLKLGCHEGLYCVW